MRCPRCGNENPDDNRFCGMCGGSLLPASEPVAQAAAQAGTAWTPDPSPPSQSPAPTRTASHSQDDLDVASSYDTSPPISGPSFLGLNDPPPASAKRASLSIDPHASSSSNLDYLLQDEDEHERRGWGAGKLVLILLLLVFAAGLGYFRWKHGLPPWSIPPDKKFPAAQSSDTAAANPAMPAGTSAGAAPSPAAAQPTATPDAGSPDTSNPDARKPGTANSGAGADAATKTPATNPAPPNSAATNPAPAPQNPTATGPAASTTDAADSSDSATPASKAPATAAETPQPAAHPKPAAALPKPSAATRPAVDSVAEAQKYLYGRGVPQDCERGMHLLKPAAAQSNPKAMIEMGALYSAGLCTPHDLPTAYRWFALALRKDPDNQSVQADLQKLWGEMTQPERQLAIKLSQ